MDVHSWHLGWSNLFAAIESSRRENRFPGAGGFNQPGR